jgi:hypothetical protein
LKQLFRLVAVFSLMLAVAAQVQGGKPQDKSSCSALCANGSPLTINCLGTCSATDASCPSSNGFVICNGVRTNCAGTCGAILPSCEAMDGTSCPTQGATIACRASDGQQYSCDCFFFGGSQRWICPF